MNDPRKLVDLGERRIIRELLGDRYGSVENFGDDAATVVLPQGPGAVVVTTDPCPPPMAETLGATDQFYAGWLLATINLSDLAAAGAEPVALVTSLILPSEMAIADFERLLDGIDACCASSGAHVVGGNLKEGKIRDLTATAIGFCPQRRPLRRNGGAPGDIVIVLGALGEFWAGVLAVQKGLLELDAGSRLCLNILTPQPKTEAMNRLAREGLVTSAIDNSDGLAPGFEQLASSSQCAMRLDAGSFTYGEELAQMAAQLGTEPLRLALGWGDWQTIITCKPKDLKRVREIVAECEVSACAVGRLHEGSGVFLRFGDVEGPLMRLESERFTRDSWFTSGLDGYIETMLHSPLVAI